MVTRERLSLLFNKYMEGRSNAAENREFMAMANLQENEALLQELMEAYQNSEHHRLGMDDRQRTQVLQHIFEQEQLPDKADAPSQIHFFNWKKITAAAVILLTVSAALFLKTKEQHTGKARYTAYQGELLPGANKATLTLADGSTLSLNDAADGELAHQAGVKVTKTADGQLLYEIEDKGLASNTQDIKYNSITTPSGGQYKIVLPDGTQVWLNATSRLKYPVSFASLQERRVELQGEAYFNVAKLKNKMPFFVSSKGQEVEVLGTHFNVNSYEDENTTLTTLLEGSVKVKRAGVFEQLLLPGQQALVNDQVKVSEVDTNTVVAWRNGLFKFENANIYTVMRQFSRWYDVDVEYQGQIPENKFTGEVYRNMDASKALKVLSFAKINFKVVAPLDPGHRKKIIISKK